MITKQVVLKQNLGTGFKSDAGRKKIDVDLSQFVDGTTTHMIGGKLVAGEEPIQVKDIFRLLANNEDNTRRLRRPGIHPILMDMPRLYNGSFIAGSTGFPRIKGNKPSLETQNYHSGERFKSFYNDTPHSELWDTGTRGNNKIWSTPLASGYVVCGEVIEVYLTVSVSYDNVGGEPEKANDTVTFRKVLRNFSSDGDIDGISSRPYADRGILFSDGFILPNGKDFTESLTADDMEGPSKWEQWEVINEIPATVKNAASGTYTASNGVKKVGNDFQLNNSESPNNNIKKLDDGSVYVPTSARVLGVRNTTSLTEFVSKDNPFFGVSSIITYTPKAEHITPTSTTNFKFNVESFISNVRITYYFKTGEFDGIRDITGLGHEHIKNISLMPSTIRATSDSLADTNVNSHLFTNNLNSRIKDLSYADGKLSFTIPKVYSYLPAEVQLVIELKDSVKSLGAGDTITFTGFTVVNYTSPDSVEGYLITYKQDIKFSLVGNGG